MSAVNAAVVSKVNILLKDLRWTHRCRLNVIAEVADTFNFVAQHYGLEQVVGTRYDPFTGEAAKLSNPELRK
jgi:hypothetical protein